MMTKVITIPQKLAQKGDLVVIPRKDYEAFLHWRKTVKVFKPSRAQKQDLRDARRDFAQGKYIFLENLEHELGTRRSS